jgi:Secretion system C-terminal sorting domain/Domain of unknown function DUF11
MRVKLSLLFIVFTLCCTAQTVTIPDINFKNALISSLCVDADLNGTYESDADLNNDGQIQFTEAQVVKRLKVSNKSISSLTGIASFSTLKILLCDNNLLTTFTLATSFGALTSLEYLDCSHNSLTTLNLYPNSTELINLDVVNCSFNQLTTINFSNTTLTSLNISNNAISSINLSSGSFADLTDLNISNNQFTSFEVNFPDLVNFEYVNNPLINLTFTSYSNNVINVTNLPTLQLLTFQYPIVVPAINLSQLPSLNTLYVNAIIENDLVLANLPSLNNVIFESGSSDLVVSSNLGFTSINSVYGAPNSLNVLANNFHITNAPEISTIDIQSFNVVNFAIDTMPNLTSLKFPDGDLLQSITINSMPALQTLEIGSVNSSASSNCIDLSIQNFNNLTSLVIKRIKLGTLVINSLPLLQSFTNNGTSCNSSTSNLTLTNLPALYTVKLFDWDLANLSVTNLTSLHDLEIENRRFTSLNLSSLPQLYSLIYNVQTGVEPTFLPMLNIQNFPNLYSIKVSRPTINGINLTNLPSLFSLIVTNDEPGSFYQPASINYLINNLPNLNYVQLDYILTPNLVFSNVPNLNTLKLKKSSIGSSYSFENLSLESVFIEEMSTINNLTFNNLPNFKHLKIQNCSNINSLSLGNTNATLQTFFIATASFIPSTSITSLNFTNFPQLTSLTARYRLLSLTLSNLPNLAYLDCSTNRLNAITLTNFPALNELIFNALQPTNTSSSYKIPVVLNLPQLTKLDVNHNNNKLADLDLSNCPMLNELHYILFNYTSTGTIPYISLKNGNPNFAIFESNPIAKICVDSTAEKNLLQSLNSNLSSTIFTTYCTFSPGGTYYVVQGNSILDTNSNGCDSSDIQFPMINLNILSQGVTSTYFANSTGTYSLPLVEGQYTITPTFENPTYYNFSPASINVDFPTTASPLSQAFCITPNGNHNDLEITFLPFVPARPGFNAVYKLTYKNKGNQTQSGTINLNFNDALLDFVSSSPAVASQTTNLLNWTYTNLQPFETRTITVTLNVNTPTETPPVVSGTILSYNAQITGLEDENISDNTSILDQAAVNAYDPNDKNCLEGPVVTTSTIGKYVHYMVRFQNTGTANAENVVVKDVIDTTKFDISTLVPFSGSHNFYTRITNTNEVEFIFEDINLPFANGSNNGYVSFKIKTKPTLIEGDTFSNQVNIYFDYNYPIVTNNYVTLIQNPLSNDQFDNENVSVYPNPVSDVVYFKTIEEVSKVEIYDMSGRILSSNSILENKLDVNNLQSGNYILKIYTQNGIVTNKIIKQ